MTVLKPYTEYRESGVRWLGAIPAEWAVKPANAVLHERKVKSFPGDEHLTPSQSHGVLPQSEYMSRTGNKVVLNLTGADSMRHVEPNDFISHLRSFQGGFEHSRLAGKVSAAYTVLEPLVGIVPEFYRYLFKSTLYVQALQTTTDQLRDGQSIRFAQVVLLPLPVPDAETQRSVASFLDRETGKIDSFIADQEELIRLLAERRAATISHAVTKGLDPSVPMRDSGVEWIGAMPAHWRMGPVRRFLKSRDSARVPLSSEERSIRSGVYPYYGASGVIDSVDDFLFDEELVLVSEDGANLVMRSKPIAFVASGKYWVNNHAHIMEPLTGSVSFWAHRIESSPVAPWVTGAAQPKLTIEALLALPTTCPSDARETERIADFVKREAAELDAAITDAREAIALSRERRSALISAAVTGKINVRETA